MGDVIYPEIDTVIVVPCYNEAKRLHVSQFARFAAKNPRVAIQFVNDGSTDATSTLLADLAGAHPQNVFLYELMKNSGKAEAVRVGMLRAFERNPRFAGYWDADLAVPLEVIGQLRDVFDRLPQIDVVVGSRLNLMGHQIERSALRRMLGPMFARAASMVLGLRFQDTQCGAKMFRCVPGLAQLFEQQFTSRWVFDVELLSRLVRRRSLDQLRRSVYEFPLESWCEPGGSKIAARDYWRAAFDLSLIFLEHRLGLQRRRSVSAGQSPVETENLPSNETERLNAA